MMQALHWFGNSIECDRYQVPVTLMDDVKISHFRRFVHSTLKIPSKVLWFADYFLILRLSSRRYFRSKIKINRNLFCILLA